MRNYACLPAVVVRVFSWVLSNFLRSTVGMPIRFHFSYTLNFASTVLCAPACSDGVRTISVKSVLSKVIYACETHFIQITEQLSARLSIRLRSLSRVYHHDRSSAMVTTLGLYLSGFSLTTYTGGYHLCRASSEPVSGREMFSKLPPELRLGIYEMVLHRTTDWPPLTAVCHLTRQEVLHLMSKNLYCEAGTRCESCTEVCYGFRHLRWTLRWNADGDHYNEISIDDIMAVPHLLRYVHCLKLFIDADAPQELCKLEIRLPGERGLQSPDLVCKKYEPPHPVFFAMSIDSLGASIEAEWLMHQAIGRSTGLSPDLLQSIVRQIEHTFNTWCQWERKGVKLIKDGKIE